MVFALFFTTLSIKVNAEEIDTSYYISLNEKGDGISIQEIATQQIPIDDIFVRIRHIDVISFIILNGYNKTSGRYELIARFIENGQPLNDSQFHILYIQRYNSATNITDISYNAYIRYEPREEYQTYKDNVIAEGVYRIEHNNNDNFIVIQETFIDNIVGLPKKADGHYYIKNNYYRITNTLNLERQEDLNYLYMFLQNDNTSLEKAFEDGVAEGIKRGEIASSFWDIILKIFDAMSLVLNFKILAIGSVDITFGTIVGVPLVLGILNFIVGWFKG